MNQEALAMVTTSTAIGSNRTINQRSMRTATEMERNAMYPGSIHLAHIHASERRNDMLVEAAHARRINEALQGRPPRVGIAGAASNLRHRIGVALVRVGHRLQHSAAQPATDPNAPLTTLRTAR